MTIQIKYISRDLDCSLITILNVFYLAKLTNFVEIIHALQIKKKIKIVLSKSTDFLPKVKSFIFMWLKFRCFTENEIFVGV